MAVQLIAGYNSGLYGEEVVMFQRTELFKHMQRYTSEVFAEHLRREGFFSYKGQDVHWYRLVNKEVIQAVYFVAFHAAPCTFAEIRYGCHPLFIPAIFQKSPLMSGLPDNVQTSSLIPENISSRTPDGVERLLLYSLYNNRPYHATDALIMCSPEQNNGLDILHKLLSVLSRTTTSRACYELHKELRQRLSFPNFSVKSTYFVEEALYWKDTEMYSYCREFVKKEAQCLENAIKKGVSIPQIYKQSWEHGKVLNQVFEDGDFEEYLSTFQARAQQNLRLLERNTGIRRGI